LPIRRPDNSIDPIGRISIGQQGFPTRCFPNMNSLRDTSEAIF
jgi:hypothetical protein